MAVAFLVYTNQEVEVLTSTDDFVLWALRRSGITVEVHSPEKVLERANVIRKALRDGIPLTGQAAE